MENRIKKLLIGFFITMIIFTVLSRAATAAMVAKVQVDTINRGNLVYEVHGTGIVKEEAHKYITLMGGYKIAEVSVKEGEEVDEGDLLFRYDKESLQDKKSDMEDELEKLKLQYGNIGLTSMSATDTTGMETAKLIVKETKEDIELGEDNIADKKETVKENKEKELKEATSNWEDIVASKEKEEKSAKRAVMDAEAKVSELNEPETKAEMLINNYIASLNSNNSAQINDEYNKIFDFYYNGKYKEHRRLVSDAEKKLTRAREDLAATQEKWDNVVIVWEPSGDENERNSYYEQLKLKNDELNNAKRVVDDAQDSLGKLTEEDTELADAITTYREYVKSNSVYTGNYFEALIKRLTEGKTASQSELEAAATNLTRAREDQEECTNGWNKKLDTARENKEQLERDIQAIEEGSYDYTKDLKEENKALEVANRSLNRAKLQQDQVKNAGQVLKENQEKQDESNDIQRSILEIDIENKQQELDDIESIISEKGEIHTPVAGIISDNDIVQGMTLTGQEKLVITTGGYELMMTAEKEDMKYFSVGDEIKINAGVENTSLTSVIENIALPDQDGKVSFTALLPEGNYQIGASLDFELTKESQPYSMCVPIQAIRQELEGTYILLAKEKDSVLGKVKEAYRMKVTVLAKDSKLAAVEAALSEKDNIIIGSNKNFSEGDRVRIYEMD